MFRHDEYTKRCSAHSFGDPTEVKTFYVDLVEMGHDLGVSTHAMESYAEAIRQFAVTAVLRKNSMDDIDPSFECSAFCSLLPGVSLVGTAA
jgi:hypothetical protein